MLLRLSHTNRVLRGGKPVPLLWSEWNVSIQTKTILQNIKKWNLLKEHMDLFEIQMYFYILLIVDARTSQVAKQTGVFIHLFLRLMCYCVFQMLVTNHPWPDLRLCGSITSNYFGKVVLNIMKNNNNNKTFTEIAYSEKILCCCSDVIFLRNIRKLVNVWSPCVLFCFQVNVGILVLIIKTFLNLKANKDKTEIQRFRYFTFIKIVMIVLKYLDDYLHQEV